MDGILNIDKPRGKTSFYLVAMVRRLSGERRVGHAGTLDPAASGVLPICLGQGTRVVEFLVDATKTYRAEIELGVVTDTYDASGQVLWRADPAGIDRARFEAALVSFTGLIQQAPPMFSAAKYRGKPLYRLARAGITVERKSRPVAIHRLELIDWRPPLATIEVHCGKGTYIRSLADDLGRTLGCGAHLKSLVRRRCGPFDIKDAISVPQLEVAFRHGYWHRLVYPVDSVLSHWAAVVVSDEDRQRIRNGRPLFLASLSPDEERCRAYALDGQFLGVLRFNSGRGQWQPDKVLG